MKVCTEWANESYDECTQSADQGYNSCDSWDSDCCDWWPCSWGCKVLTWFCVAWTWVSNVVCVVWTTITTLVCVAWTIIEIILTPIAFVIELILSIPVIGRLLDEILNIGQEIFWRLVGLPDAIAGALGFRPLKKLSYCIIILKDEQGNAVSDEATLQPAIDAAARIFREEANIQLILDGIHSVDGASPNYALDVSCNAEAWGEDLWLTGAWFNATAAWHCPLGNTGRITGLRQQIVVFCVRQIPGATAGCALGPLSDYLTIEGRTPLCLAHELGHKVGLWHCCDGTNLANGTCGGTQLDWWQVTIARDSKFVSYF
ncbi:MAG TPA: hypothetical protein VMG08_17020 [Allosphingosinicella sp.]|nr:hypothetical protein [Allosphingosinicella sp.]